MQVGKRGRERSDTILRGRDLSARDSIHSTTLGSVCIANRLVRQEIKVSHTVLYDAIFLPHGAACADSNCAGEARATCRKPLSFLGEARATYRKPLSFSSQVLETTVANEWEHENTPGRYRSTTESVMKSERRSLVRDSDPLPNCHSAHTSFSDMWH